MNSWPPDFHSVSPAQRPCDQYMPGNRQAALYLGGVGQDDPPLLRAGSGRPGHPPKSRYRLISSAVVKPVRGNNLSKLSSSDNWDLLAFYLMSHHLARPYSLGSKWTWTRRGCFNLSNKKCSFTFSIGKCFVTFPIACLNEYDPVRGFLLYPSGWNELLIASFSHRSITVNDSILLANGLQVHRNSAHSAGVGAIFDR